MTMKHEIVFTWRTADTTKLYNSLAKMFEYYMKCDEVEQAKVKSGELKKPKLRKKLAKSLATVRPQLTNAGLMLSTKETMQML